RPIERRARGIDGAGELFRFRTIALEYAKAEAIRNGVQQALSGLEAVACLLKPAQMRVHQSEIAEELALRALVSRLACLGKRRLKPQASLIESAQGVVNDPEVAQHDAFKANVAHLARNHQRGLECWQGLGGSAFELVEKTQIGQRIAFPLAVAHL